MPTEPKFPVLISYAALRDPSALDRFRRFAESPLVEVLLDSGAFTALNLGIEIPLDEYIDFLGEWGERLFGYIALDKLGDVAQTERNLDEMIRQGLRPVPVHVRGDDGDRMDDLFSKSPSLVALGGLRRPRAGWCSPEYIKQKMEWARGRPVHWLGYTRTKLVRAFRPFSCDSSNWTSGARWGRAEMYLGGWRWSSATKGERSLTRSEVALARRAGFSPPWSGMRWNAVGGSRGCFPFAVTALSHVLYAREVRREIGTRVFQAINLGDPEQADYLFNAIEATA